MNLLEIVSLNGFLLDCCGVIGLGLLGLAAVRLARRSASRSATAMTWGALALIAGRLGMLAVGQLITPFNYYLYPKPLVMVAVNTPLLLLTLGLGAVVWGFWSHEREVSGEAMP